RLCTCSPERPAICCGATQFVVSSTIELSSLITHTFQARVGRREILISALFSVARTSHFVAQLRAWEPCCLRRNQLSRSTGTTRGCLRSTRLPLWRLSHVKGQSLTLRLGQAIRRSRHGT